MFYRSVFENEHIQLLPGIPAKPVFGVHPHLEDIPVMNLTAKYRPFLHIALIHLAESVAGRFRVN